MLFNLEFVKYLVQKGVHIGGLELIGGTRFVDTRFSPWTTINLIRRWLRYVVDTELNRNDKHKKSILNQTLYSEMSRYSFYFVPITFSFRSHFVDYSYSKEIYYNHSNEMGTKWKRNEMKFVVVNYNVKYTQRRIPNKDFTWK